MAGRDQRNGDAPILVGFDRVFVKHGFLPAETGRAPLTPAHCTREAKESILVTIHLRKPQSNAKVRHDALAMGVTRRGRPDRARGVLLVDQQSDEYSARRSGAGSRAPARRSGAGSAPQPVAQAPAPRAPAPPLRRRRPPARLRRRLPRPSPSLRRRLPRPSPPLRRQLPRPSPKQTRRSKLPIWKPAPMKKRKLNWRLSSQGLAQRT